MGLINTIAGRRLVHTTSGDYNDGWTVVPITFLLYETRWGGRSYEVRGPVGTPRNARFRLLDEPVLAWLRGGELPPVRLGAGPRTAAVAPFAPAELLSAADRERLAKFLSLLDSRHEGEVLNAAKAAGALLRARQATWADVLGVGQRGLHG